MQSKPYVDELQPSDKAFYYAKCTRIGNADPLALPDKDFSSNPNDWPSVCYADLVNYLVLSPTPTYSGDQMKEYKSLEAHKQFTAGWIRELSVCYLNDVAVVRGRVMHSQSVRATPTRTWILAEKEGAIISANCDCKAGLASTCTHVGALLFKLDAASRIRERKTVTSEKARRMLPPAMRDLSSLSAEVSAVDFQSSKRKRLKSDEVIDNSPSPRMTSTPKPAPPANPKRTVLSPSRQEAFWKALSVHEPRASALAIHASLHST